MERPRRAAGRACGTAAARGHHARRGRAAHDGSIELHEGRARDPAVTLTTDEETWADIASGKISTSSATATGALSIAGEPQAVKRLRKIFSRNHMLAQADATTNRDPRARRGPRTSSRTGPG